MIKKLDINKCSALDLRMAYGRSNSCTYNDALEGYLGDDRMSDVFLTVEAERKAGGSYKSTRDFINRVYGRLRESCPYPNLGIESLVRRVSITFPDGDSEKLHFALLVSGHDYHDEVEERFKEAKKVVESAFIAKYEREANIITEDDFCFDADDFASDDD